jgi:ubiquinone/menaquinone biosynthesis C-methylase UbiE
VRGIADYAAGIRVPVAYSHARADRWPRTTELMSPPSFAETYERLLVPTIFRPWADDFVSRVQPAADERVLDVACGTGIVARLVREKFGARQRVVGVDINPDMIGVARAIAPDIDWREGSALQLPFAAASFELVLCQQGFQFFRDGAVALAEMRRVLTDRGRVALSTWCAMEENPLFHRLHQLATATFGAHVDRRFACSDAEAMGAFLVRAGFCDVRCVTVMRQEQVPDPEKFVAMNLRGTVDQLDDLSEDECAAAIARFQVAARSTIAPFMHGVGLVHPVKANVFSARV